MSAILEAFSQKAPEYHVLNILVYKDGQLLERADWDTEIRRNQYSASKTFTAMAVGIAKEEGLLSLDERLVDAFSQELPENPDENLQKATIRDLLTMCLGQEKGLLMGDSRPFLPEKNWVRYSLSHPFIYTPGERFVYSNVGPYLAGVLIQRRARMNLVDYLLPRLFTPLGITRPTWETDPQGLTFGAGGLFLSVSELGTFTQLLLNRGLWKGEQLISESWINEASAHHATPGHNPEGYGYLIWRGPESSYRSDGKYGQFGIVLPKQNAVIAVNAECRTERKLLEHLYATVFPRL